MSNLASDPSRQDASKRPLSFLVAVTAGIVLTFLLLRWLGPVGEKDDDEEEVHLQNSQVLQSPSGNVLKLSQDAVNNAGITAIPIQVQNGESVLALSDVIYLGGRAWVYQSLGADEFQKTPVNVLDAAGPSQVEVTGLHTGESVVNTGAGLLLSEELKSQMVEEF